MKPLLLLGFLALVCTGAASSGDQQRLKEYFSPDRSIVARVFTVTGERGSNPESNIEFRRRADGKLIGAKSFMSKDRRHGLGVLKALWSFDSNFFVFSMVSSGGQRPGVFPTFYFSRKATRIHLLDAALKANIVNPEFSLQAPDVVTVAVQDSAARAVVERTIRLSKLPRL